MKKQAVIEHFGGPGKVAAALGITYQSVHGWGEVVPYLSAKRLELEHGLAIDPKLYDKKFLPKKSGKTSSVKTCPRCGRRMKAKKPADAQAL